MENSLSSILMHRGNSISLTTITDPPKDLNKVDKQVIESRLSGMSLCQMPADEARLLILDLIVDGCSIVGAQLPYTDFFAGVIAKNLLEFIIEQGYGEYTYKEIILAMHLNVCGKLDLDGDIIPFTGAHFNVAYMAKVLKKYSSIRYVTDRKIQNHIDGY